jgi:hypothetical protein
VRSGTGTSSQLLFGSLALGFGAGILQFLAFAPLAKDKGGEGTQVGIWLWLGNLLFVLVLLARWAQDGFSKRTGPPVLGSLVGLLAFSLHVFVFSAPPWPARLLPRPTGTCTEG